VTTNLAGENAATLEELANELGVPLGRVVDQALDQFFSSIKAKNPSTPPYDQTHLEQAAARVRERIMSRPPDESETAPSRENG
jgi:hypothetical protein